MNFNGINFDDNNSRKKYKARLDLFHKLQQDTSPDFPQIPENVLTFIATSVSKDIHTFLKGLVRLQVYSRLTKMTENISDAKYILRQSLDPET